VSRIKRVTYEYTNAKGELRFRKIRREPGRHGEAKEFRLHSASRQDEHGSWWWRYGITDERYAFWTVSLYRLPEVVAALRVDVPVWWCEGEKDADTATAIGLTATTTPNPSDLFDGQARWFTKYETASEVMVVCDQDAHGGWWGWERYTRLLKVGVNPERITVLTAKKRKHNDLTDVLDAGLGLDGLRVVDLGRLENAAAQYSVARAASYAQRRRSTPTGKGGM
jgi:hypothetical protein